MTFFEFPPLTQIHLPFFQIQTTQNQMTQNQMKKIQMLKIQMLKKVMAPSLVSSSVNRILYIFFKAITYIKVYHLYISLQLYHKSQALTEWLSQKLWLSSECI